MAPIPAPSRRRTGVEVAGLLLLALLAAACSAPAAASPAAGPSSAARMVCTREAQTGIAGALGVTPTEAVTPTWLDHRYACVYRYADGEFTLSVEELSDRATTDIYYSGLRQQLGGDELGGVGESAFQAPSGTVVARKDFKVLQVDTSQLPGRFGSPPAARAEIAVRVALLVMGCWEEH